ncbi:MAG: hypothetical protein PGN25_21475 [Methylorubrum populi]
MSGTARKADPKLWEKVEVTQPSKGGKAGNGGATKAESMQQRCSRP